LRHIQVAFRGHIEAKSPLADPHTGVEQTTGAYFAVT
jgi:hypothetical protein